MNRLDDVKKIINQDITDDQKKKLLEDLLLDLKNEMEAQDQNMQPEIRASLSDAYQLANQYLSDKLK